MIRKRIIPVLLIKGKGLYKGVRFNEHRYIGDPMNAVKIFTDKKVDELIFLDISATLNDKTISVDFVEQVSNECYVPFAVGGGINSINQIKRILKAGAEKVVINTSAVENPNLIRESSEFFGSQSIVVSIDVSKDWLGRYIVVTRCAKNKSRFTPVEFAKQVENLGAGEIFLNCVYNDGLMKGYDLKLIDSIDRQLNIPLIACGGAGKYSDIETLFSNTTVGAAAAGSLFVFHGKHRAVLINYPDKGELDNGQ